MKICWDNLETLIFSRGGFFRKGSATYMEVDSCAQCGNSFLTECYRPGRFCDAKCSRTGRKWTEQQTVLMSNKNKGSKNHRFGQPVSEETRRKMSASRSGKLHPLYGKIHSNETKKKMKEAWKSRLPISNSTREKMSAAHKGPKNYWFGKSLPKETRLKLSMYKGPLSSNWKGGISCEPYCSEWSFKEFKDLIKERDNYKCLNPDCWKTSERLSVHYIDYNKKNCELKNLITICTSCNSRANKNRDWHQSWYQAILNKRYNYKY